MSQARAWLKRTWDSQVTLYNILVFYIQSGISRMGFELEWDLFDFEKMSQG